MISVTKMDTVDAQCSEKSEGWAGYMILASILGKESLEAWTDGLGIEHVRGTAGKFPVRVNNLRTPLEIPFLSAEGTGFFSKPSLRTRKALWPFHHGKKERNVVGSFLSPAGLSRVVNLGYNVRVGKCMIWRPMSLL